MTDERHPPLSTRPADAGTSSQIRNPRSRIKKARVVVPLDGQRTVTVTGAGLDLDGCIAALEAALGQARKARQLRVRLPTFVQMLADQARVG